MDSPTSGRHILSDCWIALSAIYKNYAYNGARLIHPVAMQPYCIIYGFITVIYNCNGDDVARCQNAGQEMTYHSQ